MSGALEVTPARRGGDSLWRAPGRYLANHPIVLLALLTPGIPEYLSSSSSLNGLWVSPIVFLLFLGFNLGLYVPGALLIREARVRWQKGWPTVIALASAYAIVEEGLALSTMFNSQASVVHGLGYYGHFAGVNWVWVPGVILIHVVYSISIPILLVDLTLPGRRHDRFLSSTGLWIAAIALAADTVVLGLLIRFGFGFFMGWPILAGALAAVAGLAYLGYRAPAALPGFGSGGRRAAPIWLGAVGFALFPGTVLIQALAGSWNVPAAITTVLLPAFYLGVYLLLTRLVGRGATGRDQLLFVVGALVPIAIIGIVGAFPTTLLADALLGSLLVFLWRKHAPKAPEGDRGPAAPLLETAPGRA